MSTRTIISAVLAATALSLGAATPASADHEAAGQPASSGFAPQGPNPGPSVSGTAIDGQVLTASRGGWPLGVSVSHRWMRCNADGTSGCVYLHADNSETYTLVPADVNKTVKIRVTGSQNTPPGSRQVDSAPTPIVDAAPPAIVTHPSNTGRAVVGATLTATPGRFEGGTPPLKTDDYQWERCVPGEPGGCTVIGGAVFLKHILTSADVGRQLRLRQTATYGPDNETVVMVSPNSGTVVEEIESENGGRRPVSPTLMRPFPVVALAGLIVPGGADISLARVRGPRGALVVVRCVGGACPIGAVHRRIGRRGSVRIGPLERLLRPGTSLVFRITQPGLVGKYTRFRIRARKRPLRTDRCLRPGTSRPSPCP